MQTPVHSSDSLQPQTATFGLARVVCAAACCAGLVLVARRVVSPPAAGCLICVASIQTFSAALAVAYALVWGVYFSLSHAGTGTRVANCLLTSLVLAFVVGLLELPTLLGVVDYRIVLSPRGSALYSVKAWLNPRNQLDKELLHLHRPNQRFTGKTSGDLVPWLGIRTDRRYQFDVQYDGRGFRNVTEITQAPIVVIGDSFVEAALVPHDALLSTRLAKRFDVPVANLGQIGYGPQQELIVLRRYALDLHPKVVLWLFFEGNDLFDFERYARSIRNWDKQAAEIHGFANRSFTKNILLTLAGFASPRRLDDSRRRGCSFLNGQSDGSRVLYFAFGEVAPSMFGAVPLTDSELATLEAAKEFFAEAQKLSAEHGATMVFVYVPTKFRVYRDLCEFPADSYAKGWELNDLPQRLGSWCRTRGIPFIDLTPPLHAAAAGGELVFFPDDGHWNDRGNELATNTIATFLQTLGLP